MEDKIIKRIIEVRNQEHELEDRKAELEVLRDCLWEEITEISKQMWELETEEKRLMEEFRKEHTREFLRLVDEDDIRETILCNGSIKAFKF